MIGKTTHEVFTMPSTEYEVEQAEQHRWNNRKKNYPALCRSNSISDDLSSLCESISACKHQPGNRKNLIKFNFIGEAPLPRTAKENLQPAHKNSSTA